MGAWVTISPLRFLPRGSSVPILKDMELFQRNQTSFPHRGFQKNLTTFWNFGLSPTYKGETSRLWGKSPHRVHLVISRKGLSSASRLAASQPRVSWESDKELLAGAGPSLPRPLPGKMPAGCQGNSNSGMTQCFHDLPSHFAWTGWYVGPTCGNMYLFLLQFQEGISLLRGIFRRFYHGILAIALFLLLPS